jgi:hypothetical protein
MDMEKEFIVLTISREFLIEAGFPNAKDYSDEMMERIAGNLADSFLQNIEDELQAAADGLTGDNEDDE